jgi:hypothetical protein
MKAWIAVSVGVALLLILGWCLRFELPRAERHDLRGGLLAFCGAVLVSAAWALSMGISLLCAAHP